jgi:hypothetical protein
MLPIAFRPLPLPLSLLTPLPLPPSLRPSLPLSLSLRVQSEDASMMSRMISRVSNLMHSRGVSIQHNLPRALVGFLSLRCCLSVSSLLAAFAFALTVFRVYGWGLVTFRV